MTCMQRSRKHAIATWYNVPVAMDDSATPIRPPPPPCTSCNRFGTEATELRRAEVVLSFRARRSLSVILTQKSAMSVARTSVRRFATSARLRNTTTQGQVYTPRSEPQPVPQQQQQPYTPPQPQPQAPPKPQPQAQPQPQPVHVGTAGNVPVEKPVGGLR